MDEKNRREIVALQGARGVFRAKARFDGSNEAAGYLAMLS